MSGARAWKENERNAAKEGEKGRVETTKVRRYRPGKVPEWMAPGADDGELQQGDDFSRLDGVGGKGRERRIGMPQIVIKQTDGRRVNAPTIVKKNVSQRQEERCVVREPRVVSRASTAAKARDDDDNDARRLALKQRLLEEEEEEEENDGQVEGGLSDIEDESSSDDYTTDSEESDVPLAKPMFVRKVERKTLEEREAIEREEIERIAQEKVRAARQAQETRKIAAQKMQEELALEEAAKEGPRGAEEIATDDEVEPEEDYEKWKERELERLRRNFVSILKSEFEAQERDAWKRMSDAEKERYLAEKDRRASDSRRSKRDSKTNRSFLQKYYHKGAFFQDEAEYKGEKAPLVGSLKQRDFSAPTGDDVFDKTLLPEVMRVKNFGKRSQSKWTHLAAEDTTRQQN
jgi:microfibrillar-associated protein 1